MLLLRKIDSYGQIILWILMLGSIPVLFIYGFLYGLIIIGTWQLISAAFNTLGFLRNGMQKTIYKYWILAGFDLLILGGVLFFGDSFRSELFENVLGFMTLFGGAAISVYYLTIERKLISILQERKELSAFTKSKN